MRPIDACQSYAARPAGRAVYENGPHVFKVYFIDITGRRHPDRYEWEQSRRERHPLLVGLKRAGVGGRGFVCAFPHIAKVFRFGPESEPVLPARAFPPADFAEIALTRSDGYVEHACLAEAVIVDTEYRLWAEARTVPEY